jgi:hypothetical protein
MAGFGRLLLLMAFAEIDGARALRRFKTATTRYGRLPDAPRLLERIRDGVYVSGTYVRDYLLEPEAGNAERHRYSLLETRRDMDSVLAQSAWPCCAASMSGVRSFLSVPSTLAPDWIKDSTLEVSPLTAAARKSASEPAARAEKTIRLYTSHFIRTAKPEGASPTSMI